MTFCSDVGGDDLAILPAELEADDLADAASANTLVVHLQLDGTGAPLWTAPWSGGDLENATLRGHELTAGHLVLLGEHITVYARADGRLVARHPLVPTSLAPRMGDPGSTKFRLADGIVLSNGGVVRTGEAAVADHIRDQDRRQFSRHARKSQFLVGSK